MPSRNCQHGKIEVNCGRTGWVVMGKKLTKHATLTRLSSSQYHLGREGAESISGCYGKEEFASRWKVDSGGGELKIATSVNQPLGQICPFLCPLWLSHPKEGGGTLLCWQISHRARRVRVPRELVHLFWP